MKTTVCWTRCRSSSADAPTRPSGELHEIQRIVAQTLGDPEGREPAAHREVEKRGLHHCARGVELRQGLAGLEGRLKTLSLEFLTRQYDRAIAAPAQS